MQPDQQLANTFLAGWQLTGPFTYLIRQAATSVDSLGKTEQRFYDQVTGNLLNQYDTHFGPPDAAPDKNLIRVVVLDDLQGTSGMARTVGIAAQRVHADAIINLGDLTATGTAQEAYLSYLKSYTVGVLSHYAGTVPVFSSLGRHDTPAVAAAAKKLHITVADGTVQKIAGLRFIGVNSPYIVNFGEAARLIDPKVTTDSVAAALRQTGCSQRPFGVFAHDKELLQSAGRVRLRAAGDRRARLRRATGRGDQHPGRAGPPADPGQHRRAWRRGRPGRAVHPAQRRTVPGAEHRQADRPDRGGHHHGAPGCQRQPEQQHPDPAVAGSAVAS